MGKGNVCVFKEYEGLFYVDSDDLALYYKLDAEDDDEDRLLHGSDIPVEERDKYEYDDVASRYEYVDFIEYLREEIHERFKRFRPCTKWIDRTREAIAENELFYICLEDNEWSTAVELIRKEDCYNDCLKGLQKRHYQKYLDAICDILLNRFDSIGTYKGAWTSGRLTRDEWNWLKILE